MKALSSSPDGFDIGNRFAVGADLAGALFDFDEWRELDPDRLLKRVSSLFLKLVGLPLHWCWHPPGDSRFLRQVFLCPTVRGCLNSNGEPPSRCLSCLSRNWNAPGSSTEGHRFIGDCAANNVLANLRTPGGHLLTVVLQAWIGDSVSGPGHSDPDFLAGSDAPRGANSRCRVTSEVLRRAEELLRLILHDLRAAAQIRWVEHERDLALELAAARHPTGRDHDVSGSSLPPASRVRGNHSRQVVQLMLDYLKEHYRHPMALREVAFHLRMNANYLSTIFRAITGIKFHRYLDALRMAQAMELLRDPSLRISEVAGAVGYVNPNHFRNVFKAHEGVSPAAWRARSQASGRGVGSV